MTKLLLTGLLAGAVAFGTACKTDKSNTNTSTGTDTDTTMTTDAGTGGAGYDTPDRSSQDVTPVPEEGVREMEPGVHEGHTIEEPGEEPGTGGTGLEPEPIDRTDSLDEETGEEPLNPGAPANTEDPMLQDDDLREPEQ
jgi:hypothetical protein